MTDVEAALRQERLEIARILHAEARKYTATANDLRADYDLSEVRDEVYEHESDANIINKIADLILARTPVVVADEAPEIVF